MTATLTESTTAAWTPEQWQDWRDEVPRLARESDAVLLAQN